RLLGALPKACGALLLIRKYYVYAKSLDGRLTWAGATSFCITRRKFTFYETTEGSSPYLGRCKERMSDGGIQFPSDATRAKFIEVDIGSGRVQNFTYFLRQ
ncbi:DUF1036 domain-containing protein, partial [Cyanobium sp. FGCU-6]|nr:DUF1036 domain-containing protein [Cyanobium sp. FGCU6]